jgi:hypothetical protein
VSGQLQQELISEKVIIKEEGTGEVAKVNKGENTVRLGVRYNGLEGRGGL